jgi:hypothetical protein
MYILIDGKSTSIQLTIVRRIVYVVLRSIKLQANTKNWQWPQ